VNAHAGPGLLDTVQGIAATTMRGLQTRLQLAAVEFEAERDRLMLRMALLVMALFFACFGLLLGVLWVVMLVDEGYRTAVLGFVALAFLAAAGVCWWLLRGRANEKGFMADTLGVLADDAQALTGKPLSVTLPQTGEKDLP
jgi:uncharacterized membrane protein YqjE